MSDPTDEIRDILDDAEDDKLTRIAAVLGFGTASPKKAEAVTNAATKALADANALIEANPYRHYSFVAQNAQVEKNRAEKYARTLLLAALSADPVAVEPAQQEPVHWRAVLAADEVPMQLNPSLHVLGFRSLKAAEARVADEEDFNGWHYTIEPLTEHAQATATIQALQEEVARLKPDAERWRALTWHWEDARDMGPGGRWWCSIMCDNEPATPAAAIDQARK
jgi:hypothetical protein